MTFSFKPPHVLFSSRAPASYATLFGPEGEILEFDLGASRFNDSAKQYTWAFLYHSEIRDGHVFTFAATDHPHVTGVVRQSKIDVPSNFTGVVLRGGRPAGRVRFVFEDDTVHVISGLSASHATLRGPAGETLSFRGAASLLRDDREHRWVFEYKKGLRDGDRFAFWSVEWSAAAVVREGLLHVVEAGETVETAEETVKEEEKPRASRRLKISIASGEVKRLPPSTNGIAGWRPPKVSIITCSHNRPEMLREAVESLRAQTDQDWEHLIVDDASSDRRVGEVLRWAQEDPRVRVWVRTRNADRPAALWNFLFDRALGRYFSVLDDDNTKLPGFVEKMSSVLDGDPGLSFVTCGFVVVESDGSRSDYHLNLNTSEEALAKGSTCDGGAILYRREIFERAGYFSEALRTNEDWDWLRRAAPGRRFKNLYECLSTYRRHETNRMVRCEDLGNREDAAVVRRKQIRPKLGVRVVRPDDGRLTESQRDAVGALDRGLRATSWVIQGTSLAVVLSPFQISEGEVVRAVTGCRRAVTVHMEDPYALNANLARVRALARVQETWVSTNDISTVPHYQRVVGNRVVVCPLLGVDEEIAVRVQPAQRDIDVLLCGYAYPSRRRFVDALLPRLRGRRVALVGNGWEGRDAAVVLPTQPLAETYALHARARTVVCLHRTHGDCSDGPVAPASVNRGFMEGYFGARVFIDRSRGKHSLDPGDVLWYDGASDLAESLNSYLDRPDDLGAAFAAKCASLYTYRVRIARILNAVRAERHLAVIP